MIEQCVILCGGLGTRLGDLTADTPKPLLPVCGTPFLDLLLKEAARQGLRRIVLLAGFRGERIEAFVRESPVVRAHGLEVRVVHEPAPAGTGGALHHALEHLDERFVLMNGDSWFDMPLRDLTAAMEQSPEGASFIAVRRIADAGRYGTVAVAGERVTGFAEKRGEAGPGLINAGIYALRKADVLPALTADCSLERDVLPDLVRRGALRAREYASYFIDIGVPEDFERAQAEIPARLTRPALFLDRDGVINVDHGYVATPDRFEWIAGAREAIARANRAGFYVFIVTNQAGVARGYYSEGQVAALMDYLERELWSVGAHIDGYRYCPHHPEFGSAADRRCSWRKPGAGMIRDLLDRWPVDAARTFLIGDKQSDMDAARAAGIAGHLFTGGNLDAFARPLLERRDA